MMLGVISIQAQSLNTFLNDADKFFQKNVSAGLINYTGIQSAPNELNSLVDQIAKIDDTKLSPNEKKAFYINAYNVSVISGIIKDYPTKSPLDIGGFFDMKKHEISGKKITLNKLEKEYLLKATGDEKLHFVLVCAAISCPTIADYAYRPENLEDQILERTKLALSNPQFIRVNKEKKMVGLSEIFRWYNGDFKDKADNIIAYLNQYRSEPISEEFETNYYNYNWSLNAQGTNEKMSKKEDEPTSNLQDYTPSVLLKRGQVELKSFYNIYTQKITRNGEGDRIEVGGRQSYLNIAYQFNYGATRSGRVNFGFDLHLATFSDGSSIYSPVFMSGENNITVFGAFGPAIRFTPFKKISKLSVRSAFWFPGARDLEDRGGFFISHDRYTSFNQIFFDTELTDKWRLFLEADMIYRIARKEDQTDFFRTPVTGILSYFPTSKMSFYGMYQYSPRFETVSNGFDEQFGLSQWFMQAGAGWKYQLTPSTEIELSYTNFFASRNDGGGETFNLGFRWIR